MSSFGRADQPANQRQGSSSSQDNGSNRSDPPRSSSNPRTALENLSQDLDARAMQHEAWIRMQQDQHGSSPNQPSVTQTQAFDGPSNGSASIYADLSAARPDRRQSQPTVAPSGARDGQTANGADLRRLSPFRYRPAQRQGTPTSLQASLGDRAPSYDAMTATAPPVVSDSLYLAHLQAQAHALNGSALRAQDPRRPNRDVDRWNRDIDRPWEDLDDGENSQRDSNGRSNGR